MPESAPEPSAAVIDCDVHPVPRSLDDIEKRLPQPFRERGLALPGTSGIKNPNGVLRSDAEGPNGEPAGSLPELMLSDWIGPNHISHAVLIPAKLLSVGVHPDSDFAEIIARVTNDWLIEEWLDVDPRFAGSILVSQMNPAAAAKEIRRLADHPSMVQVVMTSASQVPLGDRSFWPIYEAAAECGLPVAVHPGCECTGVSHAFSNGYPSSYIEWHTNLSQNFMAQLTSLVCRGAFSQFPDLRLVMVEGGFAWVPSLLWRLDKNWKGLRHTVPWLDRPPSEIICDQVRFTTQPIEEPTTPAHLSQVVEMMHGERTLLFSSDYPHWDNDTPRRALSGLAGDTQQRIFHTNAAELYGFDT